MPKTLNTFLFLSEKYINFSFAFPLTGNGYLIVGDLNYDVLSCFMLRLSNHL